MDTRIMDSLEVNSSGLKIPMWVVGLLGALISGWNGWITLTLIKSNETLVRLETRLESDVVTPGVQRELQQLRDRITATDGHRNELLKIAIENQRDIVNLTAEFNRVRRTP